MCVSQTAALSASSSLMKSTRMTPTSSSTRSSNDEVMPIESSSLSSSASPILPLKSPLLSLPGTTSGTETTTSKEATVSLKGTLKKKRRDDGVTKSNKTVGKGISTGRWTDSEHQAFLQGLQLYGREWKKVASHIPSRTSAQVRSHAQKYFTKMQRDQEAVFMLNNATPSPNGHARKFDSSNGGKVGCTTGHDRIDSTYRLSAPVRDTVSKMISNPERFETEIGDTLIHLQGRYAELQQQFKELDQEPSEETVSNIPAEAKMDEVELLAVSKDANDQYSHILNELPSRRREEQLHQKELIALSVLQGALPRSGLSAGMTIIPKEQVIFPQKHGFVLDDTIVNSIQRNSGEKRKAPILHQNESRPSSPHEKATKKPFTYQLPAMSNASNPLVQ